jgi:uncharacterized protein YoxC
MEAITALLAIILLLYVVAKAEKTKRELKEVSRKLATLSAEVRSLDQRIETIDIAVALLREE